MDHLVKEAPTKFKLNYNLFKLDPTELEITEELRNRKRNFFNPEDPFFRRKIFNKRHSSVYNTDKVLGIISPTDHSSLLSASHDEIK